MENEKVMPSRVSRRMNHSSLQQDGQLLWKMTNRAPHDSRSIWWRYFLVFYSCSRWSFEWLNENDTSFSPNSPSSLRCSIIMHRILWRSLPTMVVLCYRTELLHVSSWRSSCGPTLLNSKDQLYNHLSSLWRNMVVVRPYLPTITGWCSNIYKSSLPPNGVSLDPLISAKLTGRMLKWIRMNWFQSLKVRKSHCSLVSLGEVQKMQWNVQLSPEVFGCFENEVPLDRLGKQ